MTRTKTVLLKGELHSSEADLAEEKALLTGDVDVLVLEGSPPSAGRGRPSGWFSLSVALLAWILASLYHPMEPLLDRAEVRDVEVLFTRPDDVKPLTDAPAATKVVSAGLFYSLVPASLWIGFVTRSDLAGSLLLFLGLVLPVLVVRLYNANRPDAAGNRDRQIAETIAGAGDPGDVVLAVVGAAHLRGVEQWLPDDVDVEVHPPAHDVWSASHLRSVGLPALKAGFVLFSLYVLAAWVVARVVGVLSPVVVALLG